MTNKCDDLTLEYLKSKVIYDPDIGEFFRIGSATRADRIGKRAGTRHCEGYWAVNIGRKQFLAHRLAWFYTYGYWPTEVDHINRNRGDNRIANLREVTRSQNNRNAPANIRSKTGVRGVHFAKHAGRYCAQITVDSKTKSLGYFDTIPEAAAAYEREARRAGAA